MGPFSLSVSMVNEQDSHKQRNYQAWAIFWRKLRSKHNLISSKLTPRPKPSSANNEALCTNEKLFPLHNCKRFGLIVTVLTSFVPLHWNELAMNSNRATYWYESHNWKDSILNFLSFICEDYMYRLEKKRLEKKFSYTR